MNQKQKREHIQHYVEEWMDGFGPDGFIKNEHGNYIYSAGPQSINLKIYLEMILMDYISEQEEQ